MTGPVEPRGVQGAGDAGTPPTKAQFQAAALDTATLMSEPQTKVTTDGELANLQVMSIYLMDVTKNNTVNFQDPALNALFIMLAQLPLEIGSTYWGLGSFKDLDSTSVSTWNSVMDNSKDSLTKGCLEKVFNAVGSNPNLSVAIDNSNFMSKDCFSYIYNLLLPNNPATEDDIDQLVDDPVSLFLLKFAVYADFKSQNPPSEQLSALWTILNSSNPSNPPNPEELLKAWNAFQASQ